MIRTAEVCLHSRQVLLVVSHDVCLADDRPLDEWNVRYAGVKADDLRLQLLTTGDCPVSSQLTTLLMQCRRARARRQWSALTRLKWRHQCVWGGVYLSTHHCINAPVISVSVSLSLYPCFCLSASLSSEYVVICFILSRFAAAFRVIKSCQSASLIVERFLSCLLMI